MKSKAIQALCALCASVVLSITSTLSAQVPTQYRPGQTLSLKVTFDGVGASRLTVAQVSLSLISPLHDDQQGFATQLHINTIGSVERGIFSVSTIIPTNLASGTYKLVQVGAGTPDIVFTYSEGLPPLTITVDNSSRIAKPTLKSVRETLNP